MSVWEAAGGVHIQERQVERGVRSELKRVSPVFAGSRVARRGAKRVDKPVQERGWQPGAEMQPSHQSAWINLQDLKAQIVKRVGPEKASQYFNYFRSFIGSRLKKAELDKFVILTIGKENVPLHNQLVRAILNNAIRGELPRASSPAEDTSKPLKVISKKPPTFIANDVASPQNPASPNLSAWSNGDSFTQSPRKGRSGIRDRKANKDRLSPFGPPGKGEINSSQGPLVEDATLEIGNDGNCNSPDLSRPSQETEGATQQSDSELNRAKRLRIGGRSEVPVEETVNGGVDLRPVQVEEEDVEEEQEILSLRADGFVRAPLGIPFCPGSVGSARKAPFVGLPWPIAHLLLVDGTEEEVLEAHDLPDTEIMLKRMEEIATIEGLQGVSRECAVVLNQALDSLLKRLIKSSVDLVGSRTPREEKIRVSRRDSGSLWDKESNKDGRLTALKLHQCLNRGQVGRSLQAFGNGTSVEVPQKGRETPHPAISLLDFKVAMELNPLQLGEEWPLQLEKVSIRVIEQ